MQSDQDGGPAAVDFDDQSFDKQFGDRVRQARAERDWSQRKLAEALDEIGVKLDPSAVTRIERGNREVKLREAAAIAVALGVPIQDLSPSPSVSPREQFESLLQLAARHGKEGREALGAMAMYLAAALNLCEHHPELIPERLLTEVPAGGDLLPIFRLAIAQTVAKDPVAQAQNVENARLLMAVVESAVDNLIAVEGEESDAPET
ncbi:transcriptional regulator with XRE-family HTH domain [Mycobacteroides chelonae]|nr:transcriptional regulator with XRE-family HTH domain [Mycobacteroides chelonae]